MTNNIDELFKMLSWNSPRDLQEKGLAEARKVEYLSVFLQPRESKSVWENCARVLIEKSDLELELYLIDLFKWLQDMNWPGAELIYDRLKKMPKSFVRLAHNYCLEIAKHTDDDCWKQVLDAFWEDE